MAALRVHNLSISLDGYTAGPDQSLDNPMGVGGMPIHGWVFATPAGQAMMGMEPTGEATDDSRINDRFIEAGTDGIGATIMGRNMFGPIRDGWGEAEWIGWWGDNPPYHHDVFVLTHHARAPIPMEGGTTFYFVTDGIESALAQAVEAADGADVRLGGGASAVRQYLAAGLIDHLHLAFAPVLLGAGERLFEPGLAVPPGYEVTEFVGTSTVAHAVLTRR